MVSHAVRRYAGLRLFLQHGFPELLFVAGAGLLRAGDYLAGAGIRMDRGNFARVIGAACSSDRFSLARWNNRAYQSERETTWLVEVGDAARSRDYIRRDLLVRVAPTFTLCGLGSRSVLSLQRRGSLTLYGRRYFFLAAVAFLFGLICAAMDFLARRHENSFWKAFELPLELYVVTFCATALLPENLRPSIYGGWIG